MMLVFPVFHYFSSQSGIAVQDNFFCNVFHIACLFCRRKKMSCPTFQLVQVTFLLGSIAWCLGSPAALSLKQTMQEACRAVRSILLSSPSSLVSRALLLEFPWNLCLSPLLRRLLSKVSHWHLWTSFKLPYYKIKP